MVSSSQLSAAAIMAFAVVLVGFTGSSSAQLSTGFYSKSCPNVFSTVKSVVQSALSQERRLGASFLRLHFHDCFVNGCDGSVLLDDTSPSQLGEKTAGPNNRSLRGFKVVDDIKSKVEKICPGVVSCADILAITARDSVVILGGPSWDVKLGRRDAKTASFYDANTPGALPSPNSTLDTLISTFNKKGLSTTDMVALSGAHTIGESRCLIFRDRIYNDTDTIDTSFAQMRQDQCPMTTDGRKNRAPLDLQTPTTFDNNYFKNLINKKGLFRSDQALYSGGSTDSLVKTYSNDAQTFNDDFAMAMIKMGDIEPLTGSSGEIRKNCRKAN